MNKEIIGRIKSIKMNKTVIVAVSHMVRHPIYKKAISRTVRFAAHNEVPDLKIGENVVIVQTRKISKTKHFKVLRKTQK